MPYYCWKLLEIKKTFLQIISSMTIKMDGILLCIMYKYVAILFKEKYAWHNIYCNIEKTPTYEYFLIYMISLDIIKHVLIDRT